MTALMYLMQAMNLIPAVLAAGKSVSDYVCKANANAMRMLQENRGPSAEEWDALHADIAVERTELHAIKS